MSMNLAKLPNKLGVVSAVLASIFITHQVQANPFPAQIQENSGNHCFKTGAYIGAQVGWSRMRTKINSVLSVTGTPNLSANQSNADGRVVIDGLIGARYLFQSGFMPGIEFLGSFAEHKIETKFSYGNEFAPPLLMPLRVTISRKNTLIPSLVLGWVVARKFYLFGKLGLGISQFKTTILNPNPAGDTFTQTKIKYGFVPTLGLEYSVTPCFSVVASISYEDYSKVNQAVTFLTNPPAIPGQMEAATNQYKPSIVSGKVGLILKI